MTLGTNSESANLAFNKRRQQIDRWLESDTEKETPEIKNRPKRVKFADKCIFQAACASNDKAQVGRMIRDGYDINTVDEDGITALHQACIEDSLEMVEFLLAHGADVNISDNEGWTPLHAVATCCYTSIARLLLEHDANVVALNNDCNIPLDICKSEEIRELFKEAIAARGIDLGEARRGEELKMMEDAKRWLSSGSYDENPHPTTGATAMHVAACKGYIKVLDQLIKAGGDKNAKDFDGWTPLHAAAHWGQEEACRVLLESFADINVKNNCDQSPLDIADLSVVPILNEYKKRYDVNKNIEPAKLNILPLPPKKKVSRQGGTDEKKSPNKQCDPTVSISEDEDESEADDTVGELPCSGTGVETKDEVRDDLNQTETFTPPSTTQNESLILSSSTNSTIQPSFNNSNSSSTSTKLLDVSSSKLLDVTTSSNAQNSPDSQLLTQPPTGPIVSSNDEVPDKMVEIGSSGDKNSSLPPPPPDKDKIPLPGLEIGDDGSGGWRRTGSLRTNKTTPGPVEETGSERGKVRRTLSEASNDVNLRRAYSFESDSKFYSRLVSARNRIKAIEAASAAMTANLDTSSTSSSFSRSRLISCPSNGPSTTTTTTSTIGLISGKVTSTNVTSSNTTSTTTTTTSTPSTTTPNTQVVLRRKETEGRSGGSRPSGVISTTLAGSPTPSQTRTSPQQGTSGVQLRSGEGGSSGAQASSVSGGTTTKTAGPVSKFKQFLIKSFVPPARDEESETQRKAHAKRVRETRRSTQGVTLEELKSAEQYIKSQLNTSAPQMTGSSSEQAVVGVGGGGVSTVESIRKEEDSLERRPSWRVRVDESDRSKFSLEDSRSTTSSSSSHAPHTTPSSSSSIYNNISTTLSHSSTPTTTPSSTNSTTPPSPLHSRLRSSSNAPSGGSLSVSSGGGGGGGEEGKNSGGAQGVIAKKKRPKRRSTGVVNYTSEELEENEELRSDNEGSGRGSDAEGASESRSENGISSTRVNYRKLYEETLKENQQLKSRISNLEDTVADLKIKIERGAHLPRTGTSDFSEKHEKRAWELKFREMEEELKSVRALNAENQRLKDENGALIRVISKLSK